MPTIAVWNNASCLKCTIVEKEMVKIGPFVMCKKCFTFEFKNDSPIDPESNTKRTRKYKEWRDEYLKRLLRM